MITADGKSSLTMKTSHRRQNDNIDSNHVTNNEKDMDNGKGIDIDNDGDKNKDTKTSGTATATASTTKMEITSIATMTLA